MTPSLVLAAVGISLGCLGICLAFYAIVRGDRRNAVPRGPIAGRPKRQGADVHFVVEYRPPTIDERMALAMRKALRDVDRRSR